MFKLSKFVRLLLSVGILSMTEFDTAGGGDPSQGGGGGQGGGQGGQGGGQGGLQPQTVNPWDSVPKSWAQEHHPHWNAVTGEARKVIHDREAAFERGIQPHQQRWTRLQDPWKEYLQQTPDADLVGVYETLAQNHLAISKATGEDRKALFMKLAEHYGVSLKEVQQAAGAQGQPTDIAKTVATEVQKAVQPFQQFIQTQNQQQVRASVDAFFRDPKNEFASEVAADMNALLAAGAVRDLDSAYKLACINSPTVGPKYLAKLSQSGDGGQGGQSGTPPGSNTRNLRSSGEGAPSGKPATMDDTMKAIAEKHYGKRK